MLSILLLIFKIIGIILAVVLGILFLIIAIILYVPLCYEVFGQCLGDRATLKLKGSAHWLFHLIQVDAYYKEEKYKIRIRIAWKKITKGRQLKEEKRKEVSSDDSEMSEEELNNLLDLAICEKQEKVVDNLEEKQNQSGEREENPDKSIKDNDHDEFLNHMDVNEEEKKEEQKKEEQSKNVFEKMKYTFDKSCDKIKEIVKKKNKIMDVFTDDAHVNAALKVKSELIRVLKKVKPKACSVKLVFGCEDPKNTGDILAVLSILYPFLGEEFYLTPDFNNQTLKGRIHLKGKLRVSTFIGFLLRLLMNKNVRTTYKDMKSFEL